MDESMLRRLKLQNEINEKVLLALEEIMNDMFELKNDISKLRKRIEELESKGE